MPEISPGVKIHLQNVPIWTPTYESYWSGGVDIGNARLNNEIVKGCTQGEAILYAKNNGSFIPSFGLSYQVQLKLESREETRRLAEDFVTGKVEDTATLIKFLRIIRGKYADGLVIQYPYVDIDGSFKRDGDGIPEALQIFQMALPVIDYPSIDDMPSQFDEFLNTLYAMKDARKQIPHAVVSIDPYVAIGAIQNLDPKDERRVRRGRSDYPSPNARRVDAGVHWPPTSRRKTVSFRVFEEACHYTPESKSRDLDFIRRVMKEDLGHRLQL